MVSREMERECVVVFDEAHNIDNVCIEALSGAAQAVRGGTGCCRCCCCCRCCTAALLLLPLSCTCCPPRSLPMRVAPSLLPQ